MINNSFIKSNEELRTFLKVNLGDSKICFYKCELRNIKLNIKQNDINDFDNCVNKCIELSEYKDRISDIYYKQAKEYIQDSNLYTLKGQIREVTAQAKEYEKLNDKYYFEDYRYPTAADIKYEDMKKHEIGSLFGRNK